VAWLAGESPAWPGASWCEHKSLPGQAGHPANIGFVCWQVAPRIRQFKKQFACFKAMTKLISKATCLVLLLFAFTSNGMAQENDNASAPIAGLVSLAPILPPANFSIENRGGALDLFALPGMLARKSIEKDRIVEFRKMLVDQSLNIGEELTAALQKAFKEAGQPLSALLEAKYESNDPDQLDFKATKSSTDLILVANITEVGFVSSRSSTQFVPKLVISFELVSKKTEDADYSEKIQYGAGAKKLTEDEIPSGPKFAFDSFERAMTNPNLVVESFRQGIQLIVRQATPQMLKYIK
jgi:hypothetical protein